MLRYLSSTRGTSSPPRSDQPKLAIHVANYGILFLPSPDYAPEGSAVGPLGEDSPRHDHMMRGELEIIIPNGPRRCKSIRVGLRTTIALDGLGPGRKHEEDVLFERKVEIIGSNSDGIWLSQGSQRFDFVIIIPSNLAPHDQHANGSIRHDLFAEVEGIPDPHEWVKNSSSSSLFGLRGKSRSRSSVPHSRSTSRAPSPGASSSRRGRSTNPSSMPSAYPSQPASGASTPVTPATPGMAANPAALATALHNLSLQNGVGGGTPINPAHLSSAQSLSVTRQEPPMIPIPRTPSYDDATRYHDPTQSPAEWLIGMHHVKRPIMIVYNPASNDGANELHDRASGHVPGLGVWELVMESNVFTICAPLHIKINLSALQPGTTIFCARVLLSQVVSIKSPRDVEGADKPLVTTKNFVVTEKGRRPPAGHLHPDKHYAALWRGPLAGGKDLPPEGSEDGEVHVEAKERLPNDHVARPSTLQGVITPIRVSHALVLEVFFSVWAEDDKGQPMRFPGPGGLRMLRVSRPVTLPSCGLVPEYMALPSYECVTGTEHLEPLTDGALLPSGEPGWKLCACGLKIEEMQSRMRDAAEEENPSLAQQVAAAAAEGKQVVERGRRSRSSVPTSREPSRGPSQGPSQGPSVRPR